MVDSLEAEKLQEEEMASLADRRVLQVGREEEMACQLEEEMAC
jgi:hypothetical protein